MGKTRKKDRTAKEPGKRHHLHPYSQQPSISTREHKRRDPIPTTGSDSESDPTPPSTPDAVRRLIDPYSKPRLVAILVDAATSNPALRARLAAAAAASPSHRRLFVHGLPPHADGAALAETFSSFGSLAHCHAVGADRGRACKGYAFVSFASRAAARRALREAPRVTVAGVPVSVQLASAGADPPSGGGGGAGAGRRVYVTNVAPDASAERLRAFFARFGELEGGPFGFDAGTGASRGYALFVYQAAAGAATAVQEPYRVFEGRTLHCQLANEPARKTKAPPAVVAASAAGTPPRRAVQSVLDAAQAAGVVDLAAYARDPAQAAALPGQNPALAAAALSAALASGDAAVRLFPSLQQLCLSQWKQRRPRPTGYCRNSGSITSDGWCSTEWWCRTSWQTAILPSGVILITEERDNERHLMDFHFPLYLCSNEMNLWTLQIVIEVLKLKRPSESMSRASVLYS